MPATGSTFQLKSSPSSGDLRPQGSSPSMATSLISRRISPAVALDDAQDQPLQGRLASSVQPHQRFSAGLTHRSMWRTPTDVTEATAHRVDDSRSGPTGVAPAAGGRGLDVSSFSNRGKNRSTIAPTHHRRSSPTP